MTVLSNAQALIDWAEDGGWLDDSVLVSARLDARKRARIRIGLRLQEAFDDPKKRFNRTSESFYELTLEGDDPVLPRFPPSGPFEVRSIAEKAGRFGVVIHAGGRSVTFLAKRYRVIDHGELRRTVTLAFGSDLCFHGPGPVTIAELRTAIANAGVAVDSYDNWVGSKQMMGSAFVKAPEPEPIASGKLSGAIRIVPAGAAARDPRGLWLAGQSLASAAYVNVEVGAQTPRDLVHAVVEGLASLPGLTWASSGNMLVETREARAQWSSRPRHGFGMSTQ